jgi:hypothetical protein
MLNMAKTLVSPGVSVEVIDESFYAPSGPGTVPFILMATQQDKINPSGIIAAGTTAANAGTVYSVSSRRELINLFGTPTFPRNSSGNVILGSELSEYGLLAAHSVLEISSRAYVMRANVDLSQLVGTSTRPTGTPEGGTLWLDTTTSIWGIFEWSAATETFNAINPRVIVDSADLDGGIPAAYIGAIGDYAVVTTNLNNPVYYKNDDNAWVLVGSSSWQNSIPAINSSNANPTLTIGNSIEINNEVVTLTGTTAASLVTRINAASITGVTAEAISGVLYIYATNSATSDGSTVDGLISIANVSGTPLTALGIVAGTYGAPAVQLSFHTSVPEWKSFDTISRPTGSVWVKTTAVASGANLGIYRWNANTLRWVLQNAPLYETDEMALRFLDPTRGGLGISPSIMYVQYDINGNNTVTYRVRTRKAIGPTIVTGTNDSPTFVIGESFTIGESAVGTTTINTATVTMSGTTAETFVEDVLGAGLNYVGAYVDASGTVAIEHSAGGVMYLDDVSGTPLADAGITINTEFCRPGPDSNIIASNWVSATYTASATAPVAIPVNNTKWYYSTPIEVDIMVHNGTTWKGYQNVASDARGFDLTDADPNGPIISASRPIEQSNGSALAYGDLWIDTSDLENYPSIYRYQSVGGEDKWVSIDLEDDTSENGIIFADARWDTDGTTDVILDEKPAITDLLTSDYLDLDAPSATVYPRGMLLFNTRRSSFNVKEFALAYFNIDDFPLEIMPTERNSWVSISGNRANGVPYFGRKAVRNLIVEGLKQVIDTSEELREDSRFFNLIACPGYPELTQNMIALNSARRETAFIIGDLPMGLSSDTTTLENYLTNAAGELEDNEFALVTNNQFVANFYPSAGLTNDTTGAQVAVPASHMMLRTFIKSDNRSFPWFAPAGEQRGQVDNASAIGYINRNTGSFVSIGTREGLRDLLYLNRVNPIAVFSGIGILNYGQKTRASTFTALDRINVARLIAYIRYQLERITKPLIFEPNDKITRNEAKQAVESLLNDILANRGLYDYLVVCDESNNTPERIDRNELHLDIAIEPTKAVEFIYIPVRIKNTGEIASGNNVSARSV